MTALARQAVRAAYLGQHGTMQYGAAVVHHLVRRWLLGQRPEFTAAEARAVQRRCFALMRKDLEHAEAGDYPESLLFQLPVFEYARLVPRLVRDIPRVLHRMKRGDWQDLPRDLDLTAYPPYYRRTFHWQSDGYLSRRSAELYDIGVELLFGGMGDVMRRQVLPPIVALARQRGVPLRVLDVGCGTGRTLAQLERALPEVDATGMDLSPFYLDVAREQLPSWITLTQDNAESMQTVDDASFDVVVSVFLFHELPRSARRRVVAAMRRVLRPGGLVVLADSVQSSDGGDITYFLERFSSDMHEPFYRDYLRDDLAGLLAEHGFEVVGEEDAFLAKIVSARVPV
jgi:ubiquinone/menaquinone biosynthesis C-methylase UbiE